MSMMEIMDRLVMSEESNGSAGGTGHPAAKKQSHRNYAIELKRRIVEETFAPGAMVAGVARRHGVNDNVVFEWRKRYRQGRLVDKRTPARKALPAPDLVRIAVIDHDGGVCPPPEASGHSVPLPESGVKRRASLVLKQHGEGGDAAGRLGSVDGGVERFEAEVFLLGAVIVSVEVLGVTAGERRHQIRLHAATKAEIAAVASPGRAFDGSAGDDDGFAQELVIILVGLGCGDVLPPVFFAKKIGHVPASVPALA
jgi:transposase-like protein